jgi:flagellar biosynthesis protein
LSDIPESSHRDPPEGADPVAVALRYRWSQGMAPTVVAAGRGETAKRIIAAAEANGVPIRRQAELAEALSLVELGDQIPLEAYAAVAEVIAYLVRLDSELPARAAAADRTGPEAGR